MILTDLSINQGDDTLLNFTLTPNAPISGWTIQFEMMLRYGGVSGLIIANVASGFNNVSGINVINGPAGQFTVTIPASGTANLNSDSYVYSIRRLDPGFMTTLAEGAFLILPD